MYQSGATIVTTHAPDKVSMDFCNYWFENRGQGNVFQLVVAHKHQDNSLGTTDFDANISFVTVDNHPASVKAAAVLETVVHEIAHQFGVDNSHVDKFVSVPRHDNRDLCIMSYSKPVGNGIAEFYTDCIYDIRDASDPR